MATRLFTLLCLTLFMGCHVEEIPQEERSTVPEDWFYMQRAYPSGNIDRQAFYRARAQQQPYAFTDKNLRSDPIWENVGPVNIGGRITDIEMWPGDTATILSGTASGGIFRSDDQGLTWRTVFDEAPTLAIGDLAIAPSANDIVYAGTGEANAGGGSLAYDGLGIFKSTDKGLTWTPMGLSESGSIGRLAVDPNNPDRVYAAAMGRLFTNSTDRGLFRSIDGGENWENVLFVNDSTGVIDVVLHPTNPNIVYAASWERVRRPQRRSYAGPGSGIWKSEDGGDTWNAVTLPNSSITGNLGRIGLATSPATPDHVLAYVVHPNGRLHAVYISKDQGQSWQSISTLGIDQVSFMWWYGKIWMHPTIPEQYYLAGLNLHAFGPNANRWSTIFQGTHVDQHALVAHPNQPDLLVAGNDGGVYVSKNGGTTFRHVQVLPITQFYTAHIDRTSNNRYYGGTQDNGVIRTRTGANDDWEIIFFADGFRTIVDPSDSSTIYLAYQYGNLMRSTNNGLNFFSARNGIQADDRRNWHTPIVMSPTNSNTLYYGSQRVYKSTNKAFSWSPISPDLTRGDGGGNLTFGTLTDISVSPRDPDLIYAGADDGSLWRTQNGGGSWEPIGDNIPNRWITTVLASPDDAREVFLTVSGFRYGEHEAQVYRSTDYGDTWTPLHNGLPDVPVNDIILTQYRSLYLATDVGVFCSEDLGASWRPFQSGMPPLVVTDLDYNPETNVMLAATYGRSMFKTIIEDNTTPIQEITISQKPIVFPNPATTHVNVSWQSTHTGRGALSLMNIQGQILRRSVIDIKADLTHQVNWDTNGLLPGIYLIRLVENDQIQWVEEVLIGVS